MSVRKGIGIVWGVPSPQTEIVTPPRVPHSANPTQYIPVLFVVVVKFSPMEVKGLGFAGGEVRPQALRSGGAGAWME